MADECFEWYCDCPQPRSQIKANGVHPFRLNIGPATDEPCLSCGAKYRPARGA